MEVEILEDSSELLKVLVSLPRRKLAKDKHISISKWQIIEELKNQNLTFNKCLEGPEQMNNWGRDNMLLEAEFVFSKERKTKKTSTSSTTRTSKRGNRRTSSVKSASKNITIPGTTEED
jgi:hypothetical protein